jgi:hypothetical protein
LRLLKSDLANKTINNIEEKLNFLNNLDTFIVSEKSLYSNVLLNSSKLNNLQNEFTKEYTEQIKDINPLLVDLKIFDDYHNALSKNNKYHLSQYA